MRVLSLILLLGFRLSAQTSVVFYSVDVFDGFQMLRRQTVTVVGGMIRSVAPAGTKAPANSIDGKGKTLLPGLIDAHVHIAREDSLEQAAALGVTTELDMFGDPKELIPLKRAIEQGEHPDAADFRTAGTGANVLAGHPSELGGPPFPALKPGEDIQAFVDARFAEGSDYLKILYDHTLPGLTVEQLRGLVAAAHKRGKLAVVHETVQKDGLEAIQAGADGIEHVFDDSAIAREFIDAAVANHVTVTPTLAIISAVGGRSSGAELAKDPHFTPYLLDWTIGTLSIKLPASSKHHYEYAQGAVRALHQAGVTLLAGTDSPNPDTTYGASLHEELLLLAACGLSNEEALRAATSGPARRFGLIDRGRIQAGRRADLLLVNGDPSKDLRATRDIAGVWKAGRPIDRPAIAKRFAAAASQTSTGKRGSGGAHPA